MYAHTEPNEGFRPGDHVVMKNGFKRIVVLLAPLLLLHAGEAAADVKDPDVKRAVDPVQYKTNGRFVYTGSWRRQGTKPA